MNRRHFLMAASGAAVSFGARRRKVLIVLVDGFGPEYLAASDMPNLKRLISGGAFKIGKGVIPSVTNVNNASLVTASFPAEHGITSNFFYDPATGKSVEMESSEFLLRPTVFERAAKAGIRSALVSAKDKVKTLLERGAAIAVSAEKPSPEFISSVGPKPDMYSPASNYWAFRAARQILRRDDVGMVYLSTTDYMMHTYAPSHGRSLEHLHAVDRLLGEIVDDHAGLELCLTADHGMNAKTQAIDVARVLARKGVEAEAVPIIKDKHVVHHQNLGGACYVYLANRKDLAKASGVLRAVPGIEEVHDRAGAAREFRLLPDRIGDLFLLGARDVAFGALTAERDDVNVRSHGSRYEAAVPMLSFGRKIDIRQYRWSLDLTRRLAWEDAS